MSLGILLVLVLANPLVANSPTIPYEDDLLIVSGNSLMAKNNPDLPLKTSVLASLTGETDIDYLKGLVRKKYPVMAEGLIKLTKCEATWQHDGLWGDNYQSYGLFQFQKDTFYSYCEGNWQDASDQLDCAVVLIKQGLGSKPVGWYNCWRIENLDRYF